LGAVLVANAAPVFEDREQTTQKIDRATALPLWALTVITGEGAAAEVKVPADRMPPFMGKRVMFGDLSARAWEVGDRHGVSFSATRIAPQGDMPGKE
jgi:hypothetical protein